MPARSATSSGALASRADSSCSFVALVVSIAIWGPLETGTTERLLLAAPYLRECALLGRQVSTISVCGSQVPRHGAQAQLSASSIDATALHGSNTDRAARFAGNGLDDLKTWCE